MGMKVPMDKDKNRRSKRFDQDENSNGSTKASSPSKKMGGTTAAAPPNPNGTPANPVAEDDKNSFSKELARLQFFGAGPKMSGLPNDKTAKEKTRGLKLNFEYDPVSKPLWNIPLSLLLI